MTFVQSVISAVVAVVCSIVALSAYPCLSVDLMNLVVVLIPLLISSLLVVLVTAPSIADYRRSWYKFKMTYAAWYMAGLLSCVIYLVVRGSTNPEVSPDAANLHITADFAPRTTQPQPGKMMKAPAAVCPYTTLHLLADIYVFTNTLVAIIGVARLTVYNVNERKPPRAAVDAHVLSHRIYSSSEYREPSPSATSSSLPSHLEYFTQVSNTCVCMGIAIGLVRVLIFWPNISWGTGGMSDMRFMMYAPLLIMLRSTRTLVLSMKRRIALVAMFSAVLLVAASLLAIIHTQKAGDGLFTTPNVPSYMTWVNALVIMLAMPCHALFIFSKWTSRLAPNMVWLVVVPGGVLALVLSSFWTIRIIGALACCYCAAHFLLEETGSQAHRAL